MSLFAHRAYRRLFAAQVSALCGTGLATVALGLLAYQLAGKDAGLVLGTALTIKMAVYVTIAPVAAVYADRLPRRGLLVALDLVRVAAALTLPFVHEVWQVYLSIAVLQTASAVFTPAFQATLPDILPDERDYTRALSASQLAATMESLLSPVLAALLLTVLDFHRLFAGTALGFLASAILVAGTAIPDPVRRAVTGIWDRTAAGMRIFAATPRLRGLLGVNLVVAAVGSVVMVNTVNYVRDVLGGSPADVAVLLAANGFGTMLAALALPRALDRVGERSIVLAGAGTLVLGIAMAVTMALYGPGSRAATLAVWAVIGAGTGLAITPAGRVLRRSAHAKDRPALFAAQFSLSHLCWLITYPLAGRLATATGFATTWIVLGLVAGAGLVAAVRCWPRHDPAALGHVHDGRIDPGHVHDAVPVGANSYRHTHTFVIDDDHRRWPTPVG
ncbi:MFS transporter [Nocardia zapadnayensis]|uniref:MFS transporter n=1 Tax=Nocardia rhamnosiphila TaxID=426716 RepID=UPI002246707E|nr:MFS transporter [Nocardia zapadnayensis]MCX0273477.1 MFS transporter [Nocardia zapadnayensis]